MAAFVTVLFACFLASHARAVPPVPAAAVLAELQAALGEGGLEDAQEVGLALRRLGLATVLEVGLLDAAERLELTEHLKTAEISLGDRARLRRMTALQTKRADGALTVAPTSTATSQSAGRRASSRQSSGNSTQSASPLSHSETSSRMSGTTGQADATAAGRGSWSVRASYQRLTLRMRWVLRLPRRSYDAAKLAG